MKTIIVATDYSGSANNAIKYAAALAMRTNSTLVLVNSFELSVAAANTLLPASSMDEMFSENKKRLKDIAINTSQTFGIPVKCRTGTSFLRGELDYQVEHLDADLVVVGMSESCSKHEFENDTISIIRHAKYPVLAIPEDASFEEISKILFAFDPDCMHAANKLPLLIEVAELFNAQIEVCHVQKKESSITVNQYYPGNVPINVEGLPDKVLHLYKDITEVDVVKGIESGIKDFKPDLLVMVPHKYGFWESIWHKSKTSKMTRRTHIPLLALPNPGSA
jgi:nucleotide-binding universal stress UspA family protein